MANPTIKIVNAQTGEEIEREMNAAEFSQYEADSQANAVKKQAEADKAAQRLALADRLGLSVDELATLLS
jgi:predicted RNase H-like nuclease